MTFLFLKADLISVNVSLLIFFYLAGVERFLYFAGDFLLDLPLPVFWGGAIPPTSKSSTSREFDIT